MTVIETYPQLIGYDQQVYEYFKEQYVIFNIRNAATDKLFRSHLCGYDLNLSYPQNGTFPTLNLPFNENFDTRAKRRKAGKTMLFKQALKQDILERRTGIIKRNTPRDEERLVKREQWKRDLSGRANGTIDPWYECDIYDEMIDYALNFSLPWSKCYVGRCNNGADLCWAEGNDFDGFDVYQIPDALDPEAPMDASVWLNGESEMTVAYMCAHVRCLIDNHTRAAIHAPTSKDWVESINYPFSTLQNS